jgi:carboxypeptidase Q
MSDFEFYCSFHFFYFYFRAILWTGEEQGYQGAKYYEKIHAPFEKEEFNFFLESDMGTFEPRGLGFSGNPDAECIFKEVLK